MRVIPAALVVVLGARAAAAAPPESPPPASSIAVAGATPSAAPPPTPAPGPLDQRPRAHGPTQIAGRLALLGSARSIYGIPVGGGSATGGFGIRTASGHVELLLTGTGFWGRSRAGMEWLGGAGGIEADWLGARWHVGSGFEVGRIGVNGATSTPLSGATTTTVFLGGAYRFRSAPGRPVPFVGARLGIELYADVEQGEPTMGVVAVAVPWVAPAFLTMDDDVNVAALAPALMVGVDL